MTENNIIRVCPNEHIFRKGEGQRYSYLNLWIINNSLNSRKHVIAVLIDYSKAFDTLDHGILLRELQNIGVEGSLLNWSSRYLENIPFLIKVAKTTRKRRLVNQGVPQKKKHIGPNSIHIYINSLAKVNFSNS